MPRYSVTVWASYETEVEADSEYEAENKAMDEMPFGYCDHCDIEEMEE